MQLKPRTISVARTCSLAPCALPQGPLSTVQTMAAAGMTWQELKAAGNAEFGSDRFQQAAAHYTAGIEKLRVAVAQDEELKKDLAILLSNRGGASQQGQQHRGCVEKRCSGLFEGR